MNDESDRMSEYTDNIMSHLESGPMTSAELTKAIYPDCQSWEFNSRRTTVKHHLLKMLNYKEIYSKRVACKDRAFVTVYARIGDEIVGDAFISYDERIKTLLNDGKCLSSKDIATAVYGEYTERSKNNISKVLSRMRRENVVSVEYRDNYAYWRLAA